MGMFDTLHFPCPKCGKRVSEQSKAGPCQLKNYSLTNAPLSVIADVEADSKGGAVHCEHCGQRVRILVQRMVQVIPYEPEFHNQDDGEDDDA